MLAWRADFDARVLAQTAAFHHRALPPVRWADVRPAYVKARPGGRHSLADAMRREGFEWGGAPPPRRSRLPGGARRDARRRQRLTGAQAGEVMARGRERHSPVLPTVGRTVPHPGVVRAAAAPSGGVPPQPRHPDSNGMGPGDCSTFHLGGKRLATHPAASCRPLPRLPPSLQ